VNPDLGLALDLADEADVTTLVHFRDRDLVVETKPDLTPVSEADRAVEVAMRRRLGTERPDHGVLGEELGEHSPGAAWRWVLDPIDGTKNYVRGIPVWGTLIALQHEGETVVGVVSAPALGRRWWAARGEGAFANGVPIGVSGVSGLADALLSYDEIVAFDRMGLAGRFLALTRRAWRVRGFSDFWAHMLVAEGAVDVAVHAEPGARLWDLAPLKIIVEEAGGRFTDLSGAVTDDGGTAVSSNGLLHDEVLAALR
jgi:histidinol-phosphatase